MAHLINQSDFKVYNCRSFQSKNEPITKELKIEECNINNVSKDEDRITLL
jgi:hypothetical protein